MSLATLVALALSGKMVDLSIFMGLIQLATTIAGILGGYSKQKTIPNLPPGSSQVISTEIPPNTPSPGPSQ